MPLSVAVVVPTLGRSPHLRASLEALRADARGAVEIVLVAQGGAAPELPPGLADRVLVLSENLGFAGGCNLGFAETAADLVGTVNDDALVAPGWMEALARALEEDPGLGAAQGANLRLDRHDLADGSGIAWNAWWQAVQVGRGDVAPRPGDPPRQVFGASATAVLYRRAALEAVALARDEFFDARLVSYYEDVDLAARLRAAGWTAALVPAARAWHAGGVTGKALGRERIRLLVGNRLLVLARILGSALPARLPRILLRDVLDLARAMLRGDAECTAGIPAGWRRARRLWRGYARRGAPAPPLERIRRFRV